MTPPLRRPLRSAEQEKAQEGARNSKASLSSLLCSAQLTLGEDSATALMSVYPETLPTGKGWESGRGRWLQMTCHVTTAFPREKRKDSGGSVSCIMKTFSPVT